MTITQVAIQLLLLMAIGFFMTKTKLVPREFSEGLTTYVLDFAAPCIVAKTLIENFTLENLHIAMNVLLYGLGLCLFFVALGQLLYHLLGKTDSANITRLGLIFSNISFFGLPVVEAVLGSEGLFYYILFTMAIRIAYYALPPFFLTPPQQRETHSVRDVLKGVFAPAVCGTLIGSAIALLQIRLPEPILSVIASVAGTCTPLGMILCGMIMGRYELRSLVNLRYLRIPMLRNIAAPALVFLLVRILPLDRMTAQLCIIYSALPMGTMLTPFAARYCKSDEAIRECSASLVISTLLALITIPVWMSFIGFLNL